jgi:NAD(P)-dependent dehydrogenase (short-subunit alcohol dehydrogenase family)
MEVILSDIRTGRLNGKVAIVTGAASGIGNATALIFLREGACVVFADMKPPAEESLLGEHGGRALSVEVDVSNEGSVADLVRRSVDRFQRLDILVNCAGVSFGKPEVETSIEDWERVLKINTTGTFLTTKHVIPHMENSGGGSIVNIASIASQIGWAGYGAYCASKGAVRSFTKATAVAHGKDGIRANSINPGVIETPMTAKAIAENADRYKNVSVLGRFGVPADVAACCLFLASDEASFVTGSELTVDGGRLAS